MPPSVMHAQDLIAILAPVRAVIAERRRALDDLEKSIIAAEQAFGASVPPVAVPTAGRRSSVAAGSLEDRILGVLRDAGAPVKMPALVKHAKAKPYQVKTAVAALIEARRVDRTGRGPGTRYALVK